MSNELAREQGQRVIAIGGSAGSIEPLVTIVRSLPSDFAPPIFVVIHTAPDHGHIVLANILNQCGTIQALNVVDSEIFRPNRIYVAHSDQHMTINRMRTYSAFGAKENMHRPAIDPLFRSAAAAMDGGTIGILLSGRLDDGAAGMRSIHRGGGITIVQDPKSAREPSMPKSAIALFQIDYIMLPSEIPQLLVQLTAREKQYDRP